MSETDYDVAVIGGGSAGYAAARAAADADLRTVVIDGARELGGLCILRGCMPSKVLLYAAEVLHLARHPEPWGIHTGEVRFDFAALMARKRAMIREFADYRGHQLTQGTFELVRAGARFVDPHTVALSNGGKLSAKHFVLSTGSSGAPPPLRRFTLAEAGYLTSATTRCPSKNCPLRSSSLAAARWGWNWRSFLRASR